MVTREGAVNDRRTEGTGRVDAGTGVGDADEMGDEDGEADGERGERGGAVLLDGGLGMSV